MVCVWPAAAVLMMVPMCFSVYFPRSFVHVIVRHSEFASVFKKAFLSYMKDVFKMSNKKIFDASKLPLQAFAQ